MTSPSSLPPLRSYTFPGGAGAAPEPFNLLERLKHPHR